MRRRSFIKRVSLSALSTTVAASYWREALAATMGSADQPIPKRAYNSRVQLSILGFGGIVLVGQEQSAANHEVARAVDRGINYFDVAPSYGKGEAEQKLALALKPFRDRVFLAEKSGRRDADGFRAELEHSLKVLQTDHFDLFQLHAMKTMEDVKQVFSHGGAMEVMVKAREEGKIRHVGFSAHDEEVALELLDRFAWDSVLFPVNYVCYAQGNFGPRLVAKAKEKGVACLALKALAFTPWESKEEKKNSNPKCWYRPINDVDKARSALRFTLSEDVVSAIPPGDERVYRIAENLAGAFQPLTDSERRELLASAHALEPIFKSPSA
ncbi:MAG: aldo/keto reductase [Verrucomicrobia bacterium]|nr:aldo/keto reductase [Verrucomicrobiota bacterium]